MRELVAKIVEREIEPLAHDARVGDSFGNVAEESGHLAARTQKPLRIGGQQPAGFVERGVVADGSEHIEQFAIGFRCIANAVGGNHRQTQRGGQRKQRLIAALLVAAAVTLKFEIEMPGPKMALSRSMILPAASLPPCASAAASGPSSPPVRQMSPAENSSRSSSVAAPSAFVVSRILKRVISWQRF